MKFNSIQYLRAIAILLVFIYHTYIVSEKYINHENILNYFKYSGMIGVLLFFTISGFIMSYILHIQEKNFYLKRFLRIYPVFLIAVILIIFLKVLIFGAIKEPYLPYAVTLLPLEIMKVSSVSGQTIIPSYPLGIEWSLIFELFFYAIVGLFNNKLMRKFFLSFSIVWLGIIIYMYFKDHTVLATRVSYSEIFFSLYNIPFILGVIVFAIYQKINYKTTFVLKWWGISILVVLFIVLSNEFIIFSSNHFLRIVVIAIMGASLILVLILSTPQESKSNILLSVGNSSYGIYLLHLAILSIMFSVIHNILSLDITVYIVLIVMTISFLISYTYGTFDLYVYNKLKRYITNRQ